MIDHMGFRVRDLQAARRFYQACTQALDLQIMDNTVDSFIIVRSAEQLVPFIWNGTTLPAFWNSAHATSASPMHIALAARDRGALDDFHRATLAAGGKDNGPPARVDLPR
jgi:catechol 2,3-dioxygenase-like lactoylglutathione lyase family enzyme